MCCAKNLRPHAPFHGISPITRLFRTDLFARLFALFLSLFDSSVCGGFYTSPDAQGLFFTERVQTELMHHVSFSQRLENLNDMLRCEVTATRAEPRCSIARTPESWR